MGRESTQRTVQETLDDARFGADHFVNVDECCAEITAGPVGGTAPRVKSLLRPSPVA